VGAAAGRNESDGRPARHDLRVLRPDDLVRVAGGGGPGENLRVPGLAGMDNIQRELAVPTLP
jgi:hypothetical protein